WYAKITLDDLLADYANDPKVVKMLRSSADKAAQGTTEHVFHKIAAVADGAPRIADQPPLLFHPDAPELDLERDVRPLFANHPAPLSKDRAALFDPIHVHNIGHQHGGAGYV